MFENIPQFLIDELRAQYGDSADSVLAGYESERATTLRANACKTTFAEVSAALNAAGITWQPVSWYDDAFVLPAGSLPAVRELDIYEQGNVYVQSLSSMLPPLWLEVAPGGKQAASGLDVLDMCAAPGGKTCQIAALSGGGVHITACEMSAPRAEKLQFNLQRQGVRNATVMRVDARNLDDFFRFDRILLDAPCSGSGTVNARDARVPKRLTPQLVAKCCKSQRKLLSKALGLLKPGGALVYSTCSLLACENEQVVQECLAKVGKKGRYELQEICLPDEVPQLSCALDGAVVVAPAERYEGFFMAKVKRLA